MITLSGHDLCHAGRVLTNANDNTPETSISRLASWHAVRLMDNWANLKYLIFLGFLFFGLLCEVAWLLVLDVNDNTLGSQFVSRGPRLDLMPMTTLPGLRSCVSRLGMERGRQPHSHSVFKVLLRRGLITYARARR